MLATEFVQGKYAWDCSTRKRAKDFEMLSSHRLYACCNKKGIISTEKKKKKYVET